MDAYQDQEIFDDAERRYPFASCSRSLLDRPIKGVHALRHKREVNCAIECTVLALMGMYAILLL